MNHPNDALLSDSEINLLRRLRGQTLMRVIAPQPLPGTTVAVETLVLDASGLTLVLDSLPRVVDMCGDVDDYFCLNIAPSQDQGDLEGTSFYFGRGKVIDAVQIARANVKRESLEDSNHASIFDCGIVLQLQDNSSLGLFSTSSFTPELTIRNAPGPINPSDIPDVIRARTSILEEYWTTEIDLQDLP